MLPIVVPQELVRCFSYWDNGIQTGIFYREELYALVQHFPTEERMTAYQTCFRLTETEKVVCLTVNRSGYYVWQGLRSLAPKLRASQSTIHLQAPPKSVTLQPGGTDQPISDIGFTDLATLTSNDAHNPKL